MRVVLTITLALLAAVALAQTPAQTLIEWTFDEGQDGWIVPHHITDLAAADGELRGKIADWDPFLPSPRFEIQATAWQAIELRLKTTCEGQGQIYWTGTTESEHGGFSGEKVTGFDVIGDGEWHEYRIMPYWHQEGQIILLRLDLPKLPDGDESHDFAVDWIRVVELARADDPRTDPYWDFAAGDAWTADETGTLVSGPIGVEVEDRLWVAVEMAASGTSVASLVWVSDEFSKLQRRPFEVWDDGETNTYNIDLAAVTAWQGTILTLGLDVPGEATVRSVTMSEGPLGPPDVEVTYVGPANAVNRAGNPLPFVLALKNRGGADATDLRIESVELPGGMKVAGKKGWRNCPSVAPFDPVTHQFGLVAPQAVRGEVVVTLTGAGAPPEPARGEIIVEPGLDLPKADYVPEPQPVESDYEIGALYFPGWSSMTRWEPIRTVAPERKPVLGWYDEANPECADWQIKWAVEHGIKFFMVDWYWSGGGRNHDHWVHDAYWNSRYRKSLKWCMMWANHNAPNTHSEADQRAVTQYWIDNYFGTEEYYRIDDMPVVMVWSSQNMERDMAGKGGAKRLLDISQEMAKEAGYKGVYFVAMKWPEASTDVNIIEGLRDMGFAMTSIYHYMDHGGEAKNPARFDFDLVADASDPFTRAWHESSEAAGIPFLPNLSTGWHSEPWHGEKGIHIDGRTVSAFERICQDAKAFADETGVTRMVLAPVNEWGEGSYAEPNKEFGFGMYDAIRDTFCNVPEGGWPPNITPQDVGLGPYDFPQIAARYVWEFTHSGEGWGAFMGIGEFEGGDGKISFVTTSRDPAIGTGLYRVEAREYVGLKVRMKIDALDSDDEGMQLFWTTPTMATNEPASVKVSLIGDGEFHDYVLPVAENSRWKGRVTTFRLDPCSHQGARIEIEKIGLVKR